MTASPYSYFTGQVSSYTPSNGVLNLFNIQGINGSFSTSSFYSVNLSGQVGATGVQGTIGAPGNVGATGPTGPVTSTSTKVTVQVTYAGSSVLPVSFTVSPTSFVTSVSVSGAGLIMNGVTRGVPDYVAVNSKQVKANFNNLPTSSYVTTNMEPASSAFQVAYDSSTSQLICYDASSTSFRIASGDISSLPAPQVTLTLIYFA